MGDEGVLVLTNDNFQEAVDGNEFILVEFYAPWCGHCKALAPEYAKAAGILAEKDSPIKLAKLDATEEGATAEKFEVRGYPTLKFFKNGKPMEYGGGRTADTIVSWLEKKTGPPAKTLASLDDAKAYTEGKSVSIIGFFKDQTTDGAKGYLAAAGMMDDFEFGITGDDAVFAEYGVEGEAVLLLKDFDDGKAVLSEGITEESVAAFVSSESLPLVIDFNHETAQKIFSGEIKSHLLVFSSAKAESHADTLSLCSKKLLLPTKVRCSSSPSTPTKKITRGSWSSSPSRMTSSPHSELSSWEKTWQNTSQLTMLLSLPTLKPLSLTSLKAS